MLGEITAIIRDVIIIIIAATFIEMLLPRNEFHRYIRMVVGLLIILVLLSSVQGFVRMAPPVDSALYFQNFRQDLPGNIEGDLFQERLEAEYISRIQREAERVAREAAQAITSVRVEVTLQEAAELRYQVKALTLYLSANKHGEGTAITPVVIDIHSTSTAKAKAPSLPQEGLKVQEDVARYFQLQDHQVEVVFLDG
jgi:stage III sporulation protein AF